MADTGNGATIAFGTSAFTALYREIGAYEEEGGAVEYEYLSLAAASARKYLPHDNYGIGPIDCEFIFDPTDTPPTMLTPETITITYAKENSGSSNPATLAGSGFVTKRTFPDLQNSQVNMARCTIQFDGQTGPAFTAEA